VHVVVQVYYWHCSLGWNVSKFVYIGYVVSKDRMSTFDRHSVKACTQHNLSSAYYITQQT